MKGDLLMNKRSLSLTLLLVKTKISMFVGGCVIWKFQLENLVIIPPNIGGIYQHQPKVYQQTYTMPENNPFFVT